MLEIPEIVFGNLSDHISPRATRYAELGGSWNSEVNRGNHARQGSVKISFYFHQTKTFAC